MPYVYHVPANGVLGIRTNAPHLKWSWGINMPAASVDEYEACAIGLRLEVGEIPSPTPPTAAADSLGKYHYFSGIPGADELFYDRTLVGNRRLKLHVSGLLGAEPSLRVNPAYLRYVTHRFMNLHSAGYILTDIAALLMLRNGYAPLHCSGFQLGDATVLVLAPPNTGKTLTSMMACLEHGARFLAEDLAITDGKTLYSVPWTSTFRYYDRIDTSLRSRALNRLTSAMPLLELLPLGKSAGIDTMMPTSQLLTQSRITHIAILERGKEGVFPETVDQAYRKAVNLNRYEFNYVKAPTLVAYEFFNPELDLDAASSEERTLLRSAVENADQRLVVRTLDATRYAPLLADHLSRP